MMSDDFKKEEEIIKRKINFFHNSNLPIHIIFHDGTWENGSINEMGSDFFMLLLNEEGARKNGLKTMPIFFLEVKDVEEQGEKK